MGLNSEHSQFFLLEYIVSVRTRHNLDEPLIHFYLTETGVLFPSYFSTR